VSIEQNVLKSSNQTVPIEQNVLQSSNQTVPIEQNVLKSSNQNTQLEQNVLKSSNQTVPIEQNVLKSSNQNTQFEQTVLKSSNQKVPIKQPIFICECGKKYLAKSGLWYHKKNACSIKDQFEKEKEELQKLHEIERQQYKIKEEELQKLHEIERQQFEKEKEELQKQVELEKQNVETEKLRNTINNDNLNIQINAFGCENLEHITDTFKVKCLKQIYKSIPEMVIKIHFNTKYPENHNVKIPNKKLPHASIMTKDNTWKTVDKKNTISSMVDKSFNILDDTYEEHKNELTETKRKYYEKYQEKYWNNDKTLHKQLTNDVECLVLDGTR
jgi:hypothetical protein